MRTLCYVGMYFKISSIALPFAYAWNVLCQSGWGKRKKWMNLNVQNFLLEMSLF